MSLLLGSKECGRAESPYHGLNFCQGTIAEMLDDPTREIFAVIRWFGERGKIFNVHFRNIKGNKLDFMEAFPDEDDMDMARALAVYRSVGYPYMLMPGHVPQIDGRDPSRFVYCYGYIQALIDALRRGRMVRRSDQFTAAGAAPDTECPPSPPLQISVARSKASEDRVKRGHPQYLLSAFSNDNPGANCTGKQGASCTEFRGAIALVKVYKDMSTATRAVIQPQ